MARPDPATRGAGAEAGAGSEAPSLFEGGELPFDSVICFGGVDWWYHNRGHFDLQIMQQLRRRVPVLYVNSVGMRVPQIREGAMFVTRIRRKLRSIRRGVVDVAEGFGVYSPFSVPGGLMQRLSAPLLAWQVRRAAAQRGFRRPLLWINNPVAWEVVERIPSRGLAYCRTDRYEAFPGVDPERIVHYDGALKQAADLTVFCATSLFEAERGECRNPVFVDHGVDFEAFAGGGQREEPDDLRSIPRPRVGFIGSIDAHTFDAALFAQVVDLLPELQFVMVGATTFPDGWLERPHVHFLGQKPYEQVSSYPGHCDVLIMPWNRSSWIRACNPIKLKEYLASGRPVVTTGFDELARYGGSVLVAEDAERFAAAIRQALAQPEAGGGGVRERLRRETWAHQAARVTRHLRAALAPPGGG